MRTFKQGIKKSLLLTAFSIMLIVSMNIYAGILVWFYRELKSYEKVRIHVNLIYMDTYNL